MFGAVLPLLPTTPFLLLSAYFFSKSSPRLHKWLLGLPWAGEMIQDWEEHRAVRLQTKIWAISVTLLGVGFSFYMLREHHWGLKLALVALALVGVSVILRLKTRQPNCY